MVRALHCLFFTLFHSMILSSHSTFSIGFYLNMLESSCVRDPYVSLQQQNTYSY